MNAEEHDAYWGVMADLARLGRLATMARVYLRQGDPERAMAMLDQALNDRRPPLVPAQHEEGPPAPGTTSPSPDAG